MILLVLLGIVIPLLFGYAITKLIPRNYTNLERIILSVSIGFGSLSLIIFVFNQFLGFKFDFENSLFLLFILFFITVLLLITNKFMIKKLIIKKSTNKESSGVSKSAKGKSGNIKIFDYFIDFWRKDALLKSILIIMFILIIYKSLFFPIINGDGMGFHAPIIRDIYDTGTLSLDVGPSTLEFTRAYPPTFFVLGAWLNILNQKYDDLLIRGIPFVFGFLILLTVYLLSRIVYPKNSRAGLLACFLLMTFPMFVNHNVLLNNDTIFAFFGIAGIYFVISYLKNLRLSDMIFGFMLFAFAINVKQLGLILFCGVFVVLMLILFYNDVANFIKGKLNISKILKSKKFLYLIISVLLLLLIVAPYFVRNMVFFNDIFYPQLSSSLGVEGKNFVPFLYAPIIEAYERASLFYSPSYVLFSVVNFIRDKDYSMSIFFVLLVALVLMNFKRLNKEQKYLLYFSIFFTLYYVYSFLLKYRYYMVITAILCVVVASKFDDLLNFRLRKKDWFIMRLSFVFLFLLTLFYFVVILYKTYVINILGDLSARFLEGMDVLIVMHLIVILLVLLVFMLIKHKKTATILIILLLSVPSLYSLCIINYGVTTENLGTIDVNKDYDLFFDSVFKPIPNKAATLQFFFGDAYDVQVYIRDNIPMDKVLLTYDGNTYYSDHKSISIDSYRMAYTYDDYNSTLEDSLNILKNNNITYIHYRIPGWEEQVFGRGSLFSRSKITQNINDQNRFMPVYSNSEYVVYKIIYE